MTQSHMGAKDYQNSDQDLSGQFAESAEVRQRFLFLVECPFCSDKRVRHVEFIIVFFFFFSFHVMMDPFVSVIVPLILMDGSRTDRISQLRKFTHNAPAAPGCLSCNDMKLIMPGSKS